MSHYHNPNLRPPRASFETVVNMDFAPLKSPQFRPVGKPSAPKSNTRVCIPFIISLLVIASIFSFVFTLVSYLHTDYFPPAVVFGFAVTTFVLFSLLSMASCWVCLRSKLPAVVGNRRHGYKNSDGEAGRRLSEVGGLRGLRLSDTPTKIEVIVNTAVGWFGSIKAFFTGRNDLDTTEVHVDNTAEERRLSTQVTAYSRPEYDRNPYHEKPYRFSYSSAGALDDQVQEEPDVATSSRPRSSTLQIPSHDYHQQLPGRNRAASHNGRGGMSEQQHPGPERGRSALPSPPNRRPIPPPKDTPPRRSNAVGFPSPDSTDQRDISNMQRDAQVAAQPVRWPQQQRFVSTRPGGTGLLRDTAVDLSYDGPKVSYRYSRSASPAFRPNSMPSAPKIIRLGTAPADAEGGQTQQLGDQHGVHPRLGSEGYSLEKFKSFAKDLFLEAYSAQGEGLGRY